MTQEAFVLWVMLGVLGVLLWVAGALRGAWSVLTAAAALWADRDRDPDEVERRGG